MGDDAVRHITEQASVIENEYVRGWKGEGRKVIGYACIATPVEVIKAAGLLPYRLTALGNPSTEVADAYLSRFNCGFCRSLLQLGLDGRYDSLDGLIETNGCASGSGRFLEVMSGAVGIGVDAIDETAAGARKPVHISSQCGVFAESEVISHVNAGEDAADIVAGLCDAVASIVVAQARKSGVDGKYTLTGGVARIDAISKVISDKLGGTFFPFPHDPRLASAIGAALLAGME